MDEEERIISIDSNEEEENAEVHRKRILRKRGRINIKAAIEIDDKGRWRKEEEREKTRDELIMDKGRTVIGKKGSAWMNMEEKIRELKENPTIDLSAEVLEQTTLINNIADISKNLKETSVKTLREAAATIKAAVTVITDRMQDEENDSRETERLEIRKLKREIAELKRQREEEEDMRKELQKIKEERASMLREMRTSRKLVQDLCETPVVYPHLKARGMVDGKNHAEEKDDTMRGKPRIREIISIPLTPETRGIERDLGNLTMREKENEKTTRGLNKTNNDEYKERK